MAEPVSAILQGLRYQHLYSWYEILDLLDPESPYDYAWVENPSSGSVDDVTLHARAGSGRASKYIQVKFHVDHSNQYSFASLVQVTSGARSLLHKLFDSWRELRPTGPAEVWLVSNWTAAPQFGGFIRARDLVLKEKFFEDGPRSAAGEAREHWRRELGTTEDELRAFCRDLRLRLGFDATTELERHVDILMARHGLCQGPNAQAAAIDEVARWIVAGGNDRRITRQSLLEAIARRDLFSGISATAILEHGRLGETYGVPELPLHYLPRAVDLDRLKRLMLKGTGVRTSVTVAANRIGVYGEGGIGKSVLVAALAQDEEVRRTFTDGIYWVALGQEPDLLRLQETLASQSVERESFAVRSSEEGRAVLRRRLEDRSCVIVLDNVWDVHHAHAFDVVGPYSRLLITTRDGTLLTALGAEEQRIERLPEEAALSLLALWSGAEAAAGLPEAATGVAVECGYIPLALSIAGARVRDGTSWVEALDALKRSALEFLDHPCGNVFQSMRLGVDALPENERARYLELSVFPKNERIPESIVVTLWKRTGELKPHQSKPLLVNLERKALLELTRTEDGGREIVLHDLRHDFLRMLVEDLPSLHNLLLQALAHDLPYQEGRVAWHALPAREHYPWIHLSEHLCAAGREGELRELLLDCRWLEAKLRTTGHLTLLADFHMFSSISDLAGLAEALQLSTHILARAPDQLPSQFTGRLLGLDRPQVRELLDGIQRFVRRVWLRPITASLASPRSALIRTLRGHSDQVTAVAATPDGRRAVSGSEDSLVKVWDVETGEEVYTLEGHEGWVNAVQLTRDGRRAVSGSNDRTLRVWNLETGEELYKLEGHMDWIDAVALTKDDRQVVSRSVDGTVKVWDLENGRNVFTLLAPTDRRQQTASGWNYGTGLVWQIKNKKRPLGARSKWTKALAITEDARRAASASADGTLTVWDLESTSEEVRTFTGHLRPVNVLAITSDGSQVVSGSLDRTLKLWDAATGEEIRTLDDHAGGVRALTLIEGRRQAISGSTDCTLKVWDLDRGEEIRGSLRHVGPVTAVVFTADGRNAVSASADGTLKVWDLTRGEQIRTLAGQARPTNIVAVTVEARLAVSGLGDATLKVWDLKTGEEIHTLRGHSRRVSALASTAGGRMAVSGSPDGTLRVWDVEAGKETRTLARDLRRITALAATMDGRTVISGLADGTLKIWNLETGMEVRGIPGHPRLVDMVALTKDGREAISRSSEGPLRVWNLETGEEIAKFENQPDAIRSGVLLPDFRWAVSPANGKLEVWDLASRSVMASFEADASIVYCAAAPDGLTLAAGDAGGMVHFLRIERPGSGQHAER